MTLHVSPVVSQIRVYDKFKSFAKRDKYHLILTVQHLSEREVFISGAIGTTTRKVLRSVLDMLKAQGIETVRYQRGHGMIAVDLTGDDYVFM